MRGSGTKAWRFKRRIGRIQIGLEVLRHQYHRSSDRWVVYPSLVFDRKKR